MNDEAFARRFYADRAELELARHPPEGRQARRGLLRGRELLAAARELLPAGDRVHGRGARRAAHRAVAARRRVRLRRAAAARAPAALVGQALAARRARAAQRRAGRHRGRRRARALAAAVEDRDGDLPPQDDPLRVLHDRPRRGGEAQGRPLPPALPRRAVLPDRLRARARRRARLPRIADPRQGGLLLEGRARLPTGPEDFDPRVYATRTDWQLGDTVGRARIYLSDRVDWLALRHFGHAGEVSDADDGVIFETDYADSRRWSPGCWASASRPRIEAPDELADEARERLELVIERHGQPLEPAEPVERGASRSSTTTRTATSRRSGPSASPASSRWPAS